MAASSDEYRGRSRTCPSPVATAEPPHGEDVRHRFVVAFQRETDRLLEASSSKLR